MKTNVNFCDFCDHFRAADRDNNFSYKGKKALYEYLENLEEETGQEIELDVIALCCEYTEYSNIKEFNNYYGTNYDSYDNITETTVIKIDEESFIISQFQKIIKNKAK